MIITVLLSLSAIVTVISIAGIMIMSDVYQKLHFPAAIAGVGFPLITIAIWIQTDDWQTRLKTAFVMVLLFLMNGVLSHAIARARRVCETGHWELRYGDSDVEVT